MERNRKDNPSGITIGNVQRSIPVDLPALRAFASRAVRECSYLTDAQGASRPLPAIVEVSLVSDKRIAGLHRQFMKMTGPTDVLTFRHGEIVISVQTARRNAGRFGVSLLRELELLIVHGLLHLRGFDDGLPEAAGRMQSVQDEIMHRVESID